ncbi:MAG: hypothetical protein ACYTFZ_04045 [Planctomycetota bacterium]|jgi:hypothetical protein
MPEISREAVERVRERVPVQLHDKVGQAAEKASRRPEAPARPAKMVDCEERVTVDDTEGGQELFEQVLRDTTPEALQARKEQMAGLTPAEVAAGEQRGSSIRVAGYRDTPMAREFWASREQE